MAKLSVTVKLAPIEENLFSMQLLPDGSMRIERVKVVNDKIVSRELFTQDLADVALAQLDKHILHARRTGGQI